MIWCALLLTQRLREMMSREFSKICLSEKKKLEDRLNDLQMGIHQTVSETSRISAEVTSRESRASVKQQQRAAAAADLQKVEETKQEQKVESKPQPATSGQSVTSVQPGTSAQPGTSGQSTQVNTGEMCT